MDDNSNDSPSYLIPQGLHFAKARAWVWELTKAGDPMLIVDFVGALDPSASYPEDDKPEPSMGNRSIWHRMAFTQTMSDKAKEYKVKELRAMGFAGEDLSVIEDNAGGLDTNVVELDVIHEEYEGKVKETIRYVNPLRSAASNLKARNSPPKATLQALGNQLKGFFRANGTSGAQGASKPANGQQGASTQPRAGQGAQSNQRPPARPAPVPAPTNGQRGPNPWDEDPGMGDDSIPF